MGQLHMCWQRNFIHYKRLQTDRPQDSLPHKEHYRKAAHTQKLTRQTDRHIFAIWSIQTLVLIAIRRTSGRLVDDFPRGTKSVKLPSVTITKHTALQNTSVMQRIPSAGTTLPQKRTPPEYDRKVSHPCRINTQQPLE